MSPTATRLRVRTGLLTGFAALLSGGSHVLGGGRVPDPALALALLLPTAGLAYAVAHRASAYKKPRASTLVGFVGLTQLLWHVVLGWHDSLAAGSTAAAASASVEMLVSHVTGAGLLWSAVRFVDRLCATVRRLLATLSPRLRVLVLPGWPDEFSSSREVVAVSRPDFDVAGARGPPVGGVLLTSQTGPLAHPHRRSLAPS